MNNYKNLIDSQLKKYVNIRNDKLKEGVLYSLIGSGKRLRPTLTIATCHSISNNIKDAIPFACALEMIHTYSLVHDDLPAMDDDSLRRGIPTNHIVFGDAMAILVGDMLLSTAFEVMSKQCIVNPDNKNIRAMYVISKAASNMVSGQTADINHNSENITPTQLLYIHKHKTAALISASVYAGAILGNASKTVCKNLATAGFYLGLAFQIKDDYMDNSSCGDHLDKTKSDVKNNKATYYSLFGAKKSLKDINILKKRSISLIKKCKLKNKNLQNIFEEILANGIQ